MTDLPVTQLERNSKGKPLQRVEQDMSRIGKLVGFDWTGKVSWWGPLLILRTLITISHHPISNSHIRLTACRHQKNYTLDSWPPALSHFSHHHLSFIFYCLCQWFSYDPPWIHFYWITKLQLLVDSIVSDDSFVLTPTSFPTVYCSVSPLPPNCFSLFLANRNKHGPCTRII